ncbi:5'/3'-nucleotidase SurE [Rhodoflexus caldus]|uniref:5'/3'-nucleotidase SurE n=1 Tax=Rhodoflexus caldus TaxID=2891236 RepID=UPI002029BCF9|nr:5'/3'-nucleotidase SurE [Rhodoflexus caldus]
MKNSDRPLILISNDDGISAKGLSVLVEAMRPLGDLLVVAPNSPQSGMGHAITIHSPLKIHPSSIFEGVEAYESSGTPADCVKLAKYYILKGRVPDLVVSGINHGSNTSISILYSGTMSAAIEGAIEGMPAIGFSLCDYGNNADFSHTIPYVTAIAKQVLQTGLPRGTALNVNFPRKQEDAIKGIKICRQAKARWKEEFDERTDPYGRKYLWLAGSFENPDKGEDTDEWAIANNYVSVVPCLFDLTAHHAIATLNDEWQILQETAPRVVKEHYDNF